MNVQISPFDIPLIVDLIGQDLTKRDFFNCTLVNKSFYILFNPYLWNAIKWKFKVFLTADKQPLSRNGSLIHKLEVAETSMNGILQYLAGSSSPCEHLVEFQCSISDYANGFSRLPWITSVIEKNRNLKKCITTRTDWGETPQMYMQFFEVLSSHSSLTELFIQDYRTISHTIYKTLLHNLPRTLEVLRLYWIPSKNVDNSILFYGTVRDNVYPRLRSLTLMVSDYGQEGASTLILPLIQKCPVLERIGVERSSNGVSDFITTIFQADQLPSTFTEFHLGYMSITDECWQAVVSAMQNRIKSFSMNSSPFRTYPSNPFDLLTSHWAGILEAIRFQENMFVESHDIELILTACSALKVFSVFCQKDGSLSGLKTMFDALTDAGSNWNCLQLERLEIRFLDGRPPLHRSLDTLQIDSKPNQSLHQKVQIANGIMKAYQQLGRLTKLKHLRIGWYTGLPEGQFESDSNLDMSIKSGLNFLEGLKELQVLDVESIRRVNIGQQEVEWISENWPALREIRGMIIKDG
ncbi:hypothetical protein BGX27_002196, partial [Mortierella sp. AM989]